MSQKGLIYIDVTPQADDLPKRLRSHGWEIHVVSTPAEVRTGIQGHLYIVGLMRIRVTHREESLRLLNELAKLPNDLELLVLLSNEALLNPHYLEFIVRYSSDYHSEPVDLERLLASLGHALGIGRLRRNHDTQIEKFKSVSEILGESGAIRAVRNQIAKVAPVEAPVLVTGESGTGKELAARAIHRASGRAAGPFIAVNCGALPTELIQSELFGYEKGAFTGAVSRKQGRIEVANGGTLFLDEIGDLPLGLQANLLRFLQEKTLERVGGQHSITVDVRVIAATHVDLEGAIERCEFRSDLYFRLNVLPLRLPPLRERLEDIELLANAIFAGVAKEHRRGVKGFSQPALRVMQCHEWPGNVRELINRVTRAAVLCEGRLITPADLGLERRVNARPEPTLEQARRAMESDLIRRVLIACRHNVSAASARLGVSRVTLYRLMEKHGLVQA